MKNFLVKAFAVLFLLGFIASGVYLAFFMDGTWVTEDGGAVNQALPRTLILLFFGGMPLFLILWILFPKVFNKLLFKGMNSGIRNGAKLMKYKERREEQNVPDITINGMNIPAVMAAADMLAEKISGGEMPEELKQEPEALPYLCEECGFVLESTAKFCTNCGKPRSD